MRWLRRQRFCFGPHSYAAAAFWRLLRSTIKGEEWGTWFWREVNSYSGSRAHAARNIAYAAKPPRGVSKDSI